MPPVVLKLFDGQGIGRTVDGWTKRRLYASPFGEHNKTSFYNNNYVTLF